MILHRILILKILHLTYDIFIFFGFQLMLLFIIFFLKDFFREEKEEEDNIEYDNLVATAFSYSQ